MEPPHTKPSSSPRTLVTAPGCGRSLSGRSPPSLQPSTTITRAGTGQTRDRSRPTSTRPTKRNSSPGCLRRRSTTPQRRRRVCGCGSTTRTPGSPWDPATRAPRSRSRSSSSPGRSDDCWRSPSPSLSGCLRSWRPSPHRGLRITSTRATSSGMSRATRSRATPSSWHGAGSDLRL